MLSLFKHRKNTNTENIRPDYSFLGTDFHSHLLPGIDDGSPDPTTSLELIRSLQELGFQKFITTPHIIQDIYPNTPETIRQASDRLQQYLSENNISLPIRAAAEYMIDDYFEKLVSRKDLLTIDDKKVLVEFSMIAPPITSHKILFDIQMNGFVPVLAHPERYRYWHNKLSQYEQLKNAGAFLQINLTSLAGYHGKDVKKTAWKILREGWADFLATDLHHDRHVKSLHSLRKDGSWNELQQYPFLNMQL